MLFVDDLEPSTLGFSNYRRHLPAFLDTGVKALERLRSSGEIAAFGKAAYAMDIRYLGVCCGAGPHHIRALAEALGRSPPASRYSPDISKHAYLGSNKQLKTLNLEYRNKL